MHKSLKQMLKPVFDILAKPGLGNPHSPYEAELMTSGIKPVAFMGPEEVTPELQERINSGHIILVNEYEFNKEEGKSVKIHVYAQKQYVSLGKELCDRYYEENNNYEPLANEDLHERVGALLGFSEEDAQYYRDAETTIHRLISKLIPDNFRRYARKECMLMDAEDLEYQRKQINPLDLS